MSLGCQGVDHFSLPPRTAQLAFAGFQDQAGILTEFVKQVTVGDGSDTADRVEQKEGVGDTEGVCVGRHAFSLSGKEGLWQRETARDRQSALVAQLPQYVHTGGVPKFAQGVGFDLADPFARNPPMIDPICSRVSIRPGHLTDTQTQAFAQALFGAS